MTNRNDLAAGLNSVTITQSHVRWGLSLGRHHFEMTRTREARTLGCRSGAAPARQAAVRIWPTIIGTFASVSAFGLLIAGALASETSLSRAQARYSLNVALPEPATKQKDRNTAVQPRKSHFALPSPATIQAKASAPDQRIQVYVDKALDTGELQEWLGSDGQRRFLTAGPATIVNGHHCRDMVMLLRQTDGSSQTQNLHRCAGGRLQKVGVSSIPDGQLQSVIVHQIPDLTQDAAAPSPMRLSSVNATSQETTP